jgi:hypothetical protein
MFRFSLIFLCFCSIFMSCRVHQINSNHHSGDIITYYLFDSLENYIQNEIRLAAPLEFAGIAIDAKTTVLPNDGRMQFKRGDTFGLYIYFKPVSMSLERGFSNTNRYISIKGKLYPVYIDYLKEIFDCGVFKNRGGQSLSPPHHLRGVFLAVDMERKIFYNAIQF